MNRPETKHCANCEAPSTTRLCADCAAQFAESEYARQRGDHRGRGAGEVNQELREYRAAAMFWYWTLAPADEPMRQEGLGEAFDQMRAEVQRYHPIAHYMPAAEAERFLRASIDVLNGIVFTAEQREEFRERLQREFPGLTQIPDGDRHEADPADRLGTRVFDWPDPTESDDEDQDEDRP